MNPTFQRRKLSLLLTAALLTGSIPASAVDGGPDREKLLASSQISYRADGGFSGVASYGVIISCVDGRVSVLKSIYDPRLDPAAARMRQVGTMTQEQYLALVDSLARFNIMSKASAPSPTEDTLDEFTYTFSIAVGDRKHQFEAAAISRPMACSYWAIRSIIDQAANMSALWDNHAALTTQLTAENL